MEPLGAVTPLGQLPFFTERRKVSGLSDPRVVQCPAHWTGPTGSRGYSRLLAVTAPLLGEPWLLDADVTVMPTDGQQEGAVRGDNQHKPGRRPSHTD
jgi:hypothetical protein